MLSLFRNRASLAFLAICFVALSQSDASSADAVRTLEVNKKTPKLEVRYSQIGFRDTLLFYTFNSQKAVLKLRFGNKDKSFPLSATVYLFADSTTEAGIKKWLNNQHSDGLYPDVPEPISTVNAPKDVCQVTSHKFINSSKQRFGEYDNYAVTFKVSDYADMKHVKLTGFTGETKVHVQTKRIR